MLEPNGLRWMDFGVLVKVLLQTSSRAGELGGVPDVAESGTPKATAISALSPRVQNSSRCARIAGGGARDFTACPYFSVPRLVRSDADPGKGGAAEIHEGAADRRDFDVPVSAARSGIRPFACVGRFALGQDGNYMGIASMSLEIRSCGAYLNMVRVPNLPRSKMA